MACASSRMPLQPAPPPGPGRVLGIESGSLAVQNLRAVPDSSGVPFSSGEDAFIVNEFLPMNLMVSTKGTFDSGPRVPLQVRVLTPSSVPSVRTVSAWFGPRSPNSIRVFCFVTG